MQLNVMQKIPTMLLFLTNLLNARIQKKRNTDDKNLIVCIVFCWFFSVSEALHNRHNIILPFLISQRWEDLRAPKPRGHAKGSKLGSRLTQGETQRCVTPLLPVVVTPCYPWCEVDLRTHGLEGLAKNGKHGRFLRVLRGRGCGGPLHQG